MSETNQEWTFGIDDNGVCEIRDGKRVVHKSDGHKMTAVHLAMALQRIRGLEAQLTAERAARERLVAEWRERASKSDWQGADREAWAVHECASELAALDAPAVPTGPRIIGYGRTSKHFTLLWDDERIEFQKGSDGRWRNIGQPRQSAAPTEEPSV